MLSKTFLRWGGGFVIAVCYVIAVMIPVFGYGLTVKYNSPPSIGTMSIDTCNGIIAQLSQSFDQLLMIALMGNFISIVLICIIFKKFR